MKILVHSIFYRPELVGVAKYTAEMCEWLAARGHEVDVICPPPYYPRWKVELPYSQWHYQREEQNGVRVTRCPIWLPKRPGGLQRILYSLSFAATSLPVLASKLFRRPDVVFVLEPSFLNCVPSLLAAKLVGARTWLHVQDFEIDIAFGLAQLRKSWLRSALLRSESWIMRCFDVVSTISRPMQAKARSKGVGENRSVFFPNWVNTNVIFPMVTSSPLRAELGIPESALVALFSGTLNAKQGVEVLISAARTLSESRDANDDRVLFLICGDGPAAPRLQSLAAGLPNVRFIPLQPPERLNELLNAADLHLLPQLPEVSESVLPSKLLGMLASGRPVVATVGPESEIGRLVAKCGILSPPGDSGALANAIRELAADRESRERLGAEARSLAIRSLRHDVLLGDFENELSVRVASAASQPGAISASVR